MDKQRSVPTLDDVAKAAGVSTATVSRCLNAPERVAESKRLKVLEAVEALGYTPHFGARMMAAKRTYTIGAIVPTMENAIFARGLQAFQEELHRRGYTLLVASSAYQPDVEKEQIRTLVSRGADGLFLIGHDRDPQIYDYLKNQNVPTLVAWTYDPDAAQTSIGFENRAAMRELTHEVLRQGHKKIGVIAGARQGNDRVRQRIAGVEDALHQEGFAASVLTVIETDYGIDQGADAFGDMMKLPTPPTAVLCVNDVLAVGAVKRARELGIDVPGDVSITGFDDMELATIVTPPLTTVRVPHHDMGTAAACELVDMVEKKSTGKSVRFGTELKIRGSLGPAKS